MAKAKQLTEFLYTADDQPIRVRFGKRERVYANADELRKEAMELSDDELERLLITLLVEQEPNLAPVSTKHKNKSISIDFSKADWGNFK